MMMDSTSHSKACYACENCLASRGDLPSPLPLTLMQISATEIIAALSLVHSMTLAVYSEWMQESAYLTQDQKGSIDHVCRNQSCGGVSYEYILNMYRGVFYTKNQLNKLMANTSNHGNVFKNNESNICYARYDDMDKCCSTARCFILPSLIPNMYGVLRWVIQLYDNWLPMYQFVPIGLCTEGGVCLNCQQQTTLHVLLVYDPNKSHWPPVMFDIFQFPHYCTCTGFL